MPLASTYYVLGTGLGMLQITFNLYNNNPKGSNSVISIFYINKQTHKKLAKVIRVGNMEPGFELLQSNSRVYALDYGTSIVTFSK